MPVKIRQTWLETEYPDTYQKLSALAEKIPEPIKWLVPDAYDPSSYLMPIGGMTKAQASKQVWKTFSMQLEKIRSLPTARFIEKDFVPTIPSAAKRMIDWVSKGRSVGSILEPHGGEGDLVREIQTQLGVMPKILELSKKRVDKLKRLGFPAEQQDFLNYFGTHDTIMMNPPFSKGQSKLHLIHAYDLLNPGGRGVSLVPARDLIEGRPLHRLVTGSKEFEILGITTMPNPANPGKRTTAGIIGFTKR